ncbi:hypothetical protein E0493_12645 [Roseomonas sp. M0104]|uniref:Uncharacterized protein n=1 Tax=Teichococcus coralli TaxID=2545983 RepID=A0A845BG34_9PROT|nr:hypothetical protein [Pseudoroseomonas coralli]MXP64192.1 hypothetical protein [Pseudoroseomonas coralli]
MDAKKTALVALAQAERGDWEAAHQVVQAHEGSAACDWVHAHLHRWEGDAGNAAYWYRRAGQPVARGDLAAERAAIRAALET